MMRLLTTMMVMMMPLTMTNCDAGELLIATTVMMTMKSTVDDFDVNVFWKSVLFYELR